MDKPDAAIAPMKNMANRELFICRFLYFELCSRPLVVAGDTDGFALARTGITPHNRVSPNHAIALGGAVTPYDRVAPHDRVAPNHRVAFDYIDVAICIQGDRRRQCAPDSRGRKIYVHQCRLDVQVAGTHSEYVVLAGICD